VAQFSTSFIHGGRPKAGVELTRNKVRGAKVLARGDLGLKFFYWSASLSECRPSGTRAVVDRSEALRRAGQRHKPGRRSPRRVASDRGRRFPAARRGRTRARRRSSSATGAASCGAGRKRLESSRTEARRRRGRGREGDEFDEAGRDFRRRRIGVVWNGSQPALPACGRCL